MVLALQFSEQQFEAFIAKQKFPPNEFQMEILRSLAFERQNLLVNALAGSGKTSLLMQAADLLKEMGVRPSDTMFLAFNTKIRDEMNERLPPGFTAINSHRLGNSVLGATRKTRISFKKYRDICKPIASRLGYVKNNYVARTFLENLCSKAMMSNLKLFDLSDAEREALPDKLMAIVDHYSLGGRSDEEDEADNSKMIDDMLSCVPEVMMKAKSHWELTGEVTFDEQLYYPIALNLPIQQVKYVFVDECQDLNVVQQQLAIRSCTTDGTMIFVGDKKQAIFGFAGADARSFDNLKPLLDAKVLPLNINYRCGTKHLDLARAIVPQIVAHDGAIEGTVTYVKEDESPSKILKKGSLVLCRLTAPLVTTYFKLIAELAAMDKEKRVPVKVLGKDIAKDLSGILDKTSKIPGFAYINIVQFLTQYQERQRAFLEQKEAPESQLTKLDDSIEVLIVCVENFIQCASLMCLKDELKDLFGDEKDKGYKQDDYITLLTIHRAKGLEADQVAILKPDKMPLVWKGQQDWEFEQEMNILYVALTRPRKELIVFGEYLNVGAKPGADTNSRALDTGIIKEEVIEDVTDPLLAFIRIDEVEEERYRAIEAEAKRLDANNLLSGSQLSTEVIRGKNEQSKPELTVLPKPESDVDTASISEEPPPPSIEDIEKMESELPAVDIEPVADIGFAPIDDSLVSFKSHDDVEAVTVTNGVVDAPEPYKQYSILDMASAAKEAKKQQDLKSKPAPEPVVDMNQPEKKIIEDVRQAQKSLFDNASDSKSQVDEPTKPEPIPMPKVKASGDLQKDMKAVKKQKAVHAKHRTVTEVLTGISDVQQIDTLIELLQARRGELVAEA